MRCAALLLAWSAAQAFQAPQQRSLALHEGGPTFMTITWASQDPYTPASSGSVSWAPLGQPLQTAPATVHTYTAGPLGWNGTLFWATMAGLVPGALHTYTVTANGVASSASTFRAAPAAPNASASVHIGVLADMGSIELFGWLVAEEVIREHTAAPFDMLFIAGDLR